MINKEFLKEGIPFTQVANNVLYDKNLSYKAKGLFAYLYSKPNNWDFSHKRIAFESKESVKTILSGLQELERNGYLIRKRESTGRVLYYLCFSNNKEISSPGVEMGVGVEKPFKYNQGVERAESRNGWEQKGLGVETTPVYNTELLNNTKTLNNIFMESSPKGLDSSHISVPIDEPMGDMPPLRGAAKNAVASEGSQLGSSALLLNKVTIGDSKHLTSIEKKEKEKKTEKQKEKEQIERLEKEYFVPEDQRKDPECKFDYERYFKDLTDQYYDGKWKRGIIIGNYFVFKGMKFMSAKAAYLEFKRNLKPATAIIEYKWDDIDSAFEYLRESKFGKSFSWTLETVAKYVVMPEIVDGSWKKREKGGVYF